MRLEEQSRLENGGTFEAQANGIVFGDRDDLPDYFRDHVIGGPGAFVVTAKDRASFADAVRRKLLLEIAGEMPTLAHILKVDTDADRARLEASPNRASASIAVTASAHIHAVITRKTCFLTVSRCIMLAAWVQ